MANISTFQGTMSLGEKAQQPIYIKKVEQFLDVASTWNYCVNNDNYDSHNKTFTILGMGRWSAVNNFANFFEWLYDWDRDLFDLSDQEFFENFSLIIFVTDYEPGLDCLYEAEMEIKPYVKGGKVRTDFNLYYENNYDINSTNLNHLFNTTDYIDTFTSEGISHLKDIIEADESICEDDDTKMFEEFVINHDVEDIKAIFAKAHTPQLCDYHDAFFDYLLNPYEIKEINKAIKDFKKEKTDDK